MGRQALKLADGRDACAWSPTEINAACEALDTLDRGALEAVGDEGLTGLVIMLGLALRRAAPGAPNISDAQRTAYASLHSKLADALLDIKVAVNNNKLSPGTALELCSALIKTHTLRAFCPLLAAASSALLPPPGQPQPRPSHRLVQSYLSLLREAGNTLGILVDIVGSYAQPDAHQPLLSTLATELAESGLLEHWSRLALALGGCEGEHEKTPAFDKSWDSWSELLLSGSSPSLVYLLSSHLVALAAELDGGPTYGLPAAPEEEAAAGGPSTSAPAPAPKARPPLPLLDTNGYRLRPGEDLDLRLTHTALELHQRTLKLLVHTAMGVFKTQPAVCGPEGAVLPMQGTITRTCASRLRDLGAEITRVESTDTARWDPDGKWLARAVSHKEECAKVLAALRRRETFADMAAAYQLGMRLARAAALSLQGCPGLTAASCGASGEGAWEALVAAHDPSGWQDPASPPLPPLGSLRRLSPPEAVHLGLQGLLMVGEVLRPARDMCDKHGPEATPPWFKQLQGSYWRAAVAWAGLLWQRDAHAQPVPLLGGSTCSMLLYLYKTSRGESVSVDALHALPAGYLGAFEALIRSSIRETEPLPDFHDAAPYRYLLTHSRAADVASLAGTVAKLLRRHPSPEEGLGGVTALARCFALVNGEDRAAERSGHHYSTLQSGTPSGAVPAVGSGADTSGGALGAAAGEAPSFGAASGPGSGAGPDLPLSAACIALQLLPEAARVGRALAEAVLPRLSAPAPPPELRPLEDLVALLLDWMPPLVLAARPLEFLEATGELTGAGAAEAPEAQARRADALCTGLAWANFLWSKLDPAWILGIGLRLAIRGSVAVRDSLTPAFWAFAVRDPVMLADLADRAELKTSRTSEGPERSSQLQGPSGADTAASTLPGPTARVLAELLRWRYGASRDDENLLHLALNILESEDIPAMFRAKDFASGGPGMAQFYATAVSILAPPDEARRALPGCSNPACTNLAGPSEAALSVQRCACEALDTLAPTALEAVGDEGLTGLVIMLGLALRRAAPGAPGISDAQRTAYASLHSKLAVILMDIERAVTEHKLSPGTALELCTALIKTHTLRAFCPLLAAASSALLPPPGQPQPRAPRRLVQSSIVLLQEAGNTLGALVDIVENYAQPDAHQPLLSTLETELAESGLLEHWSRLALALGGCEGAEEGAARAVQDFGPRLYDLQSGGEDEDAERRFPAESHLDSWSELLLSGSSPSLVYLLSSHLVALAAELDGGPTYGLPVAPEEEDGAGPSSSAPATAPRARPPIPILNTSGYWLRPGQPVDMRLAGPAMRLWLRCVNAVAKVSTGVYLGPDRPAPRAELAKSSQATVWRTCVSQLRWLEAAVRLYADKAAAEPQPEGTVESRQYWAYAAKSNRDKLKGVQIQLRECMAVRAALRRREPFADVAAAYQLGMRLARAAVLSLHGCPGLTAASCGASGEGAWEALVAAHDPSGWQDPASPPLPPPGSAAAISLPSDVASLLATDGLSMAREALEAARRMCDQASQEQPPPWLARQLGAWWRAAMAWAGLWQRSEDGAPPRLMVGFRKAVKLFTMRDGRLLGYGGRTADVRLAAAGGYLPALEAFLRHPDGPRDVFKPVTECGRGRYLWTDLLLSSNTQLVASFSRTAAKLLLRAAASTEEQRSCLRELPGLVNLMASDRSELEPGVFSVDSRWRHAALRLERSQAAPNNDSALSAACIALQVLPVAASLARALLPEVLGLLRSGDIRALYETASVQLMLADLLSLLLEWLPPLLAASEPLVADGGLQPGVSAAGPPAPADAPAWGLPPDGARAWGELLWAQLNPAWALRTALQLTVEPVKPMHVRVCNALWALVARAPLRLAAMVAAGDAAEAREEGAGVGAAAGGDGPMQNAGPSLRLLRQALTRDAVGEVELLAAVEAVCAGAQSSDLTAEQQAAGAAELQYYSSAVSVLASPAEARRALPGCSNPACTNLAGPSEAALRLRRCGGCGGAARYCGHDCQAAHWAAGHARECRLLAAAANGREG
ncbi:hypothetical protein HYH03_006786 [Edaphochlamys debaryana]|uniref:phytol kinase n=1 Tax=Edaphochlamys debaryana TaxID=47281 RepID=A0A835Y386_9CHLO|nr:hypothetical protein HYH03_006786 [Edaphochlamys debaryana]|eukprot:KAG2495180.1 hypothetical protein HYH03_006786 [Edaphochlamys debaryana]